MKKVIQLMSTFSTKPLGNRPAFAFGFLEYLLSVRLPDDPNLTMYSDAVKDVDKTCGQEMQKLAQKFADEFMVLRAILLTPQVS